MRRMKWMMLVLAFCLLPLGALAEAELTGSRVAEGFAAMHPVNGTCVQRLGGENQYAVFSAGGEQLSAAYRQIEARQDHAYYIVTGQGDGMNVQGLVDGSGRELIPTAYGRISVVNDHWVLASVLADWSTFASTDVYFDGVKIGTLSGEEYTGSSYCTASGRYLGVAGQEMFYLSPRFERAPSLMDYLISEEFFFNWNDGAIYHPGSGQKAFDAACTLTVEDVERTVWYDDRGDFIGLRGEVVSAGPSDGREYDNVEYSGGAYLRLRAGSAIGIADMRGDELVPVAYSALGGDTRSYFAMGYQAVLRDGQLSWLNRDGEVTASVASAVSEGECQGFQVNGLFIVRREQDGAAVMTATAGELPQRYEDAVPVTSPRQRILCVKLNGLWGAIGMDGGTVIPFEHVSQLQISQDGTLAIGQNERQEQMVYAVAYEDVPVPAVTEAPQAPVTQLPVATDEPAAAQEDGWICPVCQRTNTLNFCPYDGTERPEEPPVCLSCGYELPADNDFIFCPSCGAQLP